MAAAKRIAILKAGTANRQARERLGDFSGMFQTLLAQPGHTLEVHDVEHGQFPADLGAYDGFAVTGSRASAYDPDPWIARLLETLREIHARRIPLLGMCFGHQCVAQALGGRVEKSPRGWDIGVRTLTLTPQARAVAELNAAPQPLRIHKLHADQVTVLPPGALPLAASESAAHEAFALGPTTLCLQGHAEFDNGVVLEAVERLEGAGLVTAEQAATFRASVSPPASRPYWEQLLRGFFARGGLALPAEAAPVQAVRR